MKRRATALPRKVPQAVLQARYGQALARRYVHSAVDTERTAVAAGWLVESLSQHGLREENERAVASHLVVLRRPHDGGRRPRSLPATCS